MTTKPDQTTRRPGTIGTSDRFKDAAGRVWKLTKKVGADGHLERQSIMASDQPTCQLNKEPFRQCCCNCKMRLTDYRHCSIHGRRDGKCVCSEIRGYICTGFAEEGMAHSEWPEHSCGCELYLPKVERVAAIGAVEYASWQMEAINYVAN